MSLSFRNLALLLLVAAGALWWMLRDDAQTQISRAHEELAGLLSKTGDESVAAASLNVIALRNLFADPVELSGDARGLTGVYSPEDLAGTIVRLRGLFQSIDLSFSELLIEFPAAEVAAIQFSAELTAEAQVGAVEDVIERRSVISRMQDIDGTWLFAEILLAE